jgi:hypothetical protein
VLRDRNGLRTETHITLRDDAREDTAWLQIYGRSATLQALWYKRQRGRVLLRSDKTRQDQAGRQVDRQTDRHREEELCSDQTTPDKIKQADRQTGRQTDRQTDRQTLAGSATNEATLKQNC